MCKMLVKVNYFTADKGESLTCKVFKEVEMVLFCVDAEFFII